MKEDILTKAFRFELAFDGEPEHVGVFQGVSDIGLAEDEVNSFLSEFSDLKIPELSRNSESWFTLLGLKEFFEAIKNFHHSDLFSQVGGNRVVDPYVRQRYDRAGSEDR